MLITRNHGEEQGPMVSGTVVEVAKRKAMGDELQGVDGVKRVRLDELKRAEISKEPFLTVSDKATKADDAPAPVHLFDNRIHAALGIEEGRRPMASEALDVLRRFGLRLWKRRVRASFSGWVKRLSPSVDLDRRAMVHAGWDACRRVDGASCWDWDAGSALLFWRCWVGFVVLEMAG